MKTKAINEMVLEFPSQSSNESFARAVVACFAAQLDPTINELEDIKTAVSEAVTNCVVHAYPESVGEIEIACEIVDDEINIAIIDQGVGINNVELAKKPFYTSKPHEDRSGMGFAVMEGFMDKLDIDSTPGKGTKVSLYKKLA